MNLMNIKKNISYFKNKTILITGGTGSFGKIVLKKLLNHNLKEIRVFSRDEKKQEDLRFETNSAKVKFIVGDVRDYENLKKNLKDVDFVFHAAALKQVPTCEFYPYEAVKTNIIGTKNLIDAAIENKVRKVIFLSTDKAVYPINAMGISKSMAEKIVISEARQLRKKNDTIFCITRYGNVMGSRGSIIPRFIDRLSKNKDLLVTDSKMSRFLMTLEESIDLVFHSLINGKQGEIFIQKTPGCKIIDLAKALIKVSQKKVNIKIIGSRHGEKLSETLISREEMVKAINEKSYFRIPLDNRSLDYNLYENKGTLKTLKIRDYNSDTTDQLNISDIVKIINKNNFYKKNYL